MGDDGISPSVGLEVGVDVAEFVLGLLYPALQAMDDGDAAGGRVEVPRLRLVHDALHRLVPPAGVGPGAVQRLEDVADAEQAVRVAEDARPVVREVPRQRAVRRAAAALVLARRARSGRRTRSAAAAGRRHGWMDPEIEWRTGDVMWVLSARSLALEFWGSGGLWSVPANVWLPCISTAQTVTNPPLLSHADEFQIHSGSTHVRDFISSNFSEGGQGQIWA